MFLWCLTATAQTQEISMKLNFKHIDCGVRRGFSCKEPNPTETSKVAAQYNATYILGKTVIILRIHRDQITVADEIQLFGERITKRNRQRLKFELPEEEPLDNQVLQFINEDMRTMHPFLEAKSYLTIISKNYIDITLIGETD
jgi:hypothetical protein